MSFLIIQQIVMILQAHSSYLQVHSQTILAPCQEWKDGLLFIISLFICRELDENDVHIGKLCHAPDSPLHGPLAHNSNTWMGSNCLSIRESWGVVGICVSTCKIMVQSWVCVWCWFTLSNPTITDTSLVHLVHDERRMVNLVGPRSCWGVYDSRSGWFEPWSTGSLLQVLFPASCHCGPELNLRCRHAELSICKISGRDPRSRQGHEIN